MILKKLSGYVMKKFSWPIKPHPDPLLKERAIQAQPLPIGNFLELSGDFEKKGLRQVPLLKERLGEVLTFLHFPASRHND
jgi:hypothetical protein